MAEPIREIVMQTVEARFAAIKADEGQTYSQTVVSVKRDIWDIGTNPPRPSIWILEARENKVQQNADIVGSSQNFVKVVVTYVADALENTGTIKNRMLADLTRAIGSEFTITDSYGTRDTVQVVEGDNLTSDGSEGGIVWVQVEYTLSYHHALGDQTRIAEED